MEDRTEPDSSTRSTEEDEAGLAHRADRPPTESEESAADRHFEESEEERKSVAEHYEEMSEIGAEAKGEGRIE